MNNNGQNEVERPESAEDAATQVTPQNRDAEAAGGDLLAKEKARKESVQASLERFYARSPRQTLLWSRR